MNCNNAKFALIIVNFVFEKEDCISYQITL